MSDYQWFAFRAYNSQTLYGYGTADEADAYSDHLNKGKEINLYAAHPLGNDDETDAAHRDNGISLEDELAAIEGEG